MTVDERDQPGMRPARSWIRERVRQHVMVPNITIVERPGRLVESVWFRKIVLQRRRNVIRVTVVG